jgi:hypothetical protein
MAPSLGGEFKRRLFHVREVVFRQIGVCSQPSASSSALRSGNGFDMTPNLFVVHEANANRTDLFAARDENAEYPSAGPGAEGERPSLARDAIPPVIATEAKQSRATVRGPWIASSQELLPMTAP